LQARHGLDAKTIRPRPPLTVAPGKKETPRVVPAQVSPQAAANQGSDE
jgi:hypothetical protein